MKLKNLIRIFYCAVSAMVVFSSCHIWRKAVASSEYPTVAAESTTLTERFDAVIGNIHEWESMSVPVSVNISSPTSISFNGKAYFTRDRSIFISLRKLGFEVAQLYLTNDSVYCVDKFNKRYIADSLKGAMAHCPVNIHDVQNMFLGQPFLPGGQLSPEKFTFEERADDASWMAMPIEQPNAFQLGFVFSINENSPAALAVQSGSSVFTVEYPGHQSSMGGTVALSDVMTFKSPKLTVAVTLRWAWNQARWNNADDVKNWSMPKGSYKRIEAASLLKALNTKS